VVALGLFVRSVAGAAAQTDSSALSDSSGSGSPIASAPSTTDSGPDVSGEQPGPAPVRKSGPIASELRRYLADGRTILLAPIDWDAKSWAKAGAIVGSIALLSTQDERIDRAISRNDSSGKDSVASAVTPFGSYAALGISFASLGGGLLFHDAELRDTGRDALEAELFAAGIVTPLLKTAFGRKRPSQGADADELRPVGGDQSFPSGHATMAFAAASVFAARSKGWVVPTIAYTLASAVGWARMHDRAHYASDVVAGAVIGTAIGQSVVRSHAGEKEGSARGITWTIVPVAAGGHSGFGLGVTLAGPPPRRPEEPLPAAPVLNADAAADEGRAD